jgi:hypothetical protein
MKYDFFVAGRTRNSDKLEKVLQIIRKNGKTAWCFIEKSYMRGADAKINLDAGGEKAHEQFEALDLSDDLVKQIFDDDLAAERDAENFLLVLPAGISGHVEAGIAFGLGKKCYALGKPEKTESLYHIFDKIFNDTNEFREFLEGEK